MKRNSLQYLSIPILISFFFSLKMSPSIPPQTQVKLQNLFFLWVCSLLFQPLLHPFLCTFYLRFINLSYGSSCPGLELSEKHFFDLNNLFHFCPFRHTHLPAFLPALCNTMSLVCVRSLCEPFNFVTWILWPFLNYIFFLPFFSLSQSKIGYHYESVLVFSNIRSVLEAILKHCSMAWAKEQFFKGIL